VLTPIALALVMALPGAGADSTRTQSPSENTGFVLVQGTCAVPERCFDPQGNWICACDACAHQAGFCHSSWLQQQQGTYAPDTSGDSEPVSFDDLVRDAIEARDANTYYSGDTSLASCRQYRYWQETVDFYGLGSAEANYNCGELLEDLQSRGEPPCNCD
jgi:hypothetical protein